MEFRKGPTILSPAQGGAPVKVAIGKAGDPTTFTAGEDADGTGYILIVKGSLGREDMHGIMDSMVAWGNLRADDHITPDKVAALISANFPGKIEHLDAYVAALNAYGAAKGAASPGGPQVLAPEYLSVALALLPAVGAAIPHNKVTDALRTGLGIFGVKF